MSRRTPSLARRAFPALALTAVGVGLVQGLDRPSTLGAIGGLDMDNAATTGTNAPVTGTATGSVTAAETPAGGAGTQAQGSTSNSKTNSAAAQTAPAQSVPTQNVPIQNAPAQTSPPETAAPVTAAPVTAVPATSGVCGEVAGVGAEKTITWGRTYGVISVTAKFTASGDLCDASATWQAYDNKSQRYEEYAVPLLNKQAEAADSANVQGVSGATAITNAYRSSLQSAIDNRH